METIKVVVVGDSSVGKTSFIARYTVQAIPNGEYIPTVIDNSLIKVVIDGVELAISFWDTAGSADYDYIRKLVYPDSNVFLVCCSTTNRQSYQNVYKRWLTEIQQYAPTTARTVLIGMKIEERRENNAEHIKFDEGVRMAELIAALKYVECSSITGEGVDQAIRDAIVAYKLSKK